MHAHTEYIDTHPFFFVKKKKNTTKTTQPPQLRLKGNCSGDKLFWMVKVLLVRTQGPASTWTPLDPLELGFLSHRESRSSLSSLECRQSSEQVGRQPSHRAPAESAVPRPAISFSFSCPLCPSRWPLASLLSSPGCPPGSLREKGLHLPGGCCRAGNAAWDGGRGKSLAWGSGLGEQMGLRGGQRAVK